MEQISVDNNISGQRLDKFLIKYFPNASKSFIYKMLRKKNILLNEKKASGNEILLEKDQISIYFSEDTLRKFKTLPNNHFDLVSQYELAYQKLFHEISILYEDTNIIVFYKAAGVLSQKSTPTDISINEFGIGYLLKTGQITKDSLQLNKPSICNRLDRNTSGIVLFGKTLLGLQTLNLAIKNHSIQKYYRCFLSGILKEPIKLNGYLSKNEQTNSVQIYDKKINNSSAIQTNIYPLSYGGNITYAEIELITGKTHQIRAHVASIGHPIIGDYKYGNASVNKIFKRECSVQAQLLHSYRVVFPQMNDVFHQLSERELIAPIPSTFQNILNLYF